MYDILGTVTIYYISGNYDIDDIINYDIIVCNFSLIISKVHLIALQSWSLKSNGQDTHSASCHFLKSIPWSKLDMSSRQWLACKNTCANAQMRREWSHYQLHCSILPDDNWYYSLDWTNTAQMNNRQCWFDNGFNVVQNSRPCFFSGGASNSTIPSSHWTFSFKQS